MMRSWRVCPSEMTPRHRQGPSPEPPPLGLVSPPGQLPRDLSEKNRVERILGERPLCPAQLTSANRQGGEDAVPLHAARASSIDKGLSAVKLRPGLCLPLAGLLLGLMLAQPAAAASPQRLETFAERVAEAKLVALVSVAGSPEAGFVLTVERVFKGRVGARLVFPPPQTITLLEAGWNRVVIAFDDPTTLDFRANNIAWHVADDGRLDPEGFQPYPGLPHTLAAMFLYFGPPVTSTAPPTGSDKQVPLSMLAILGASLAATLLTWRRLSTASALATPGAPRWADDGTRTARPGPHCQPSRHRGVAATGQNTECPPYEPIVRSRRRPPVNTRPGHDRALDRVE